MVDINIKNIRVMPTSLDIKTNVGKSSAEILSQLQTGSVMKAVVILADNSGKVIFNTSNGRFSAPNTYNLTIGDSVNFKISNIRGQIDGSIISINDKKLNLNQSLKLELIRPSQILGAPSQANPDENYITLKDIINTPKVISGIISYLNLNNIAKSSPLFKMISNAMEQSSSKPTLSANILPSDHIPTAAYSFNGTVSGNVPEGGQLIKTDFGIITTNETAMPIGQKLLLEMTGLNDRLINNELTQAVTDFVFNLNNSDVFINPFASLLKLKDNPKNDFETESSQESEDNASTNEKKGVSTSGSKNQVLPSGSNISNLNNLISLLGKDNEIKKLVAQYRHIKELLTPFVKESSDNFKWQSIFIPFYIGGRLIEYEIKIIRNSNEHYLRFVFNIELGLNEVQIEGLIGFEADGKTPQIFNMTLRSKIKLEPELCKKIADIYYVSQNMSGLRGTLSISLA